MRKDSLGLVTGSVTLLGSTARGAGRSL